jgi:hypothetical protein
MASAMLGCCVRILVVSEVQAAELLISNNEEELILKGSISEGDYTKFSNILLQNDLKIIRLKSGGGNLVEALQIGKEISKRKISTVVDQGEMCASACALIWMAGETKSADTSSQIGFHSPYKAGKDKKISSTGNALAGAYLARLGYDDMTIEFATEAEPEEMRWLSQRSAKYLGIEVNWIGQSPANSENIILSRDKVRKVLLLSNMGKRLHTSADYVFEYLVDHTYNLQRQGKYWRDLVGTRFFDFAESSIYGWSSFETELWKTASDGLVIELNKLNLEIAKIARQNKNYMACLLMLGDYEASANKHQTLAEIADMVPRHLSEQRGSLIARALEEPVVAFQKMTPKQRRVVLPIVDKTIANIYRSRTGGERKILIAYVRGKPIREKDRSVACDYLIELTEKLLQQPKYFGTIYKHADEL